ncbi:hypothetical protein MERGE_002996 [Pneumocystis wakefieldiae]|uniref:Structural maintenance of chromosomes protein n=1 Tax=Pneumocystis wakefieldiae TaxID=38082 RepID=A0A899FYN6_9ASCO|nr:hypothetical protein MERGE_002996 [Pneumocystis wakefieldiae]
MFIKQITIQGFKSYKDQTITEVFSPRYNVIVGKNGSGKSNFFSAIRFVLNDAYTHMGREERQALLHEGAGPSVMSAYVEIVFDNKDNRFPTGKEEVVLRRTIGLKKDEYSLDKRSVNKSDVMNLLESAGFSRSNPYYIVPQGRITALTNAKDSGRLALLKEIAGTQVYEQRRTESLKIIEETMVKKTKIDELLKYIDERLNELEQEKNELKEFQKKNRERRCLEYTIYAREQEEINKALTNIDEERIKNINLNEDKCNTFIEREHQIQEIDKNIATIKQQLHLLSIEKRQAEEDKHSKIKEKAQLEFIARNLTESSDELKNSKDIYEKKLQDLENEIKEKETHLQSLLLEFQEAKNNEMQTKNKLENAQNQQNLLYAKRGLNSQFKNKNERDIWLHQEISDLKESIKKRSQTKIELEQELETLKEKINNISKRTESFKEEIENRSQILNNISVEHSSARIARDQLMDERKELWRQEAKLSLTIEQIKEELNRAEKNLTNTISRDINYGLANAKKIAERLDLTGYYGPLYELFEVDDRYKTAVEVTAGNSLFHIVVDNEVTASKIIDILNKEKGGRITCMPLNRLSPKQENFPDASDAIPMLKKITYDTKYQKAFEQVFGKTIICPTLDIAAQYSRSHNITAITLNGDRSDKKGAFTGGFHDIRKSRLEAVKSVKKFQHAYEENNFLIVQIKKTLEEMDQKVTQQLSKIQTLEAKKRQIEQNYNPLRIELSTALKEKGILEQTLLKKQSLLNDVDFNINSLNSQLLSLQDEMKIEFKKTLTQSEEDTLENLNKTIDSIKNTYVNHNVKRTELEHQKIKLESELHENLYLRLDQLKTQGFINDEDVNVDMDETKQNLSHIQDIIETITNKLNDIESSIDHLSTELHEKDEEKALLQNKQNDEARTIEKYQKTLERNMAKRALLLQNKEECNKNIRDLGVLPEEAFEKFTTTESNTIVKRLHKVNEALKKFSHVNKKAFEQYNSFIKQRDALLARRKELDESQASIENLISVLDQRKDEAIERNFKQVSKSFSEVFEKLVPIGKGRLIMQRRIDHIEDKDHDKHDKEEAQYKSPLENYVGVAISVSFNNKEDEQRIQQLSGGQKSLCALALIFAIQRCDPAPFYLLDEVDAALDAQYRTAVATMLHEMSDNGQFICTTFRPEMIQTGDKFYGIVFKNKISTIQSIEKEEALAFVKSEAPQ